MVRSTFHSRPFSSHRLSFAGRGLPERMRTTAFAILGLTTAAALALVAIFAQLNFPLLSPVPLPIDGERGTVAEAVAVDEGSGASAVPRAHGDVVAAGVSGGGTTAVRSPAERDEHGADAGPPSPGSGSEPGQGGVAADPAETAPSAPTPPSPPVPSGAQAPAAQPTPAPAAPPAPSKSNAKPAKSKSAKPTRTKSGKSEAKTGKAEAKAVKAEAKAVKAETKAAKAGAQPEPEASSKPSTPPLPAVPAEKGNGNGKALGHGK
jgi:hypothetical protein